MAIKYYVCSRENKYKFTTFRDIAFHANIKKKWYYISFANPLKGSLHKIKYATTAPMICVTASKTTHGKTDTLHG